MHLAPGRSTTSPVVPELARTKAPCNESCCEHHHRLGVCWKAGAKQHTEGTFSSRLLWQPEFTRGPVPCPPCTQACLAEQCEEDSTGGVHPASGTKPNPIPSALCTQAWLEEQYEEDSVRGVHPAYLKFSKRLQQQPEQCARWAGPRECRAAGGSARRGGAGRPWPMRPPSCPG